MKNRADSWSVRPRSGRGAGALAVLLLGTAAYGFRQASTVPNEIQLPGTQPGEVNLEAVSRCDNCHGGYGQPAVEPVQTWSGSPMAHAGRDPLFWATVALAEQAFGGAGDLCLRCHSPDGWMEGRSTPTDGSALTAADADGVACDACHRLTNPDGSEHLGVQNAPYVANTGGLDPEAFSGSGMAVYWGGQEKLGPYLETVARHSVLQSSFHRSSALCGTCHDVSNPLVGDLAPGNGAMTPLAPGTYSGVLGGPLEDKAAFQNPPYAYGIVERTYSEHVASAFEETRVADYALLPDELQAGAIQRARDAALVAGTGGDYADGTPRSFTCQTCHMRPATGNGCDKADAPLRTDLSVHDMTGGNTWIGDAIEWLDERNRLVLGGGLTSAQETALEEGEARARANLADAAALQVEGDTVRVINLTGHKLLTGYPEGRRMWLRVTWRDAAGGIVRTDGAYGALSVTHRGDPLEVETILDLADPHLVLWEVHPGVTQEWALRLLGYGLAPGIPLAFDRETGDVVASLESVAAGAPGTAHPSFQFVLNDTILSDPRIPPYGMSRDEAEARNVLPVPASLFGDPPPGGVYRHWDEVALAPPAAARTAAIELLYQPTSWEYVQFLDLANDGSVAFLASTGADLLEAWLATGMAAPEVMATATWRASGRRKAWPVVGPPTPVTF